MTGDRTTETGDPEATDTKGTTQPLISDHSSLRSGRQRGGIKTRPRMAAVEVRETLLYDASPAFKGGMMRHWHWPVTEKKPKDLSFGEATEEYTDGKYTGFRVGRDVHGWFAFRGKARTISRPDPSLLTALMLRGVKSQLGREGKS